MRSGAISGVVLLASFCLAVPASAQVYDAAAAFSTSSNPNGAWTYGFSNTLTSSFIQDTDAFTGSQIDGWRGDRAGDGNPSLSHNKTSSSVSNGTVTYQPGQMIMHPGPNGEYSTLRFTSPSSGIYSLAALFTGQDSTTTDVHIFDNGIQLFVGAINGYLNTSAYNTTLSLTANDIVDVKVGFGSNNNFSNDSTGVSFRLTAVPEPDSLALLVTSALTGAGLLMRRRQQARLAA